MAETTITGLPNAATLTGAERVPMDQGGQTVDATTGAIAALAPPGTVTSIGLVQPTGFAVSGSPVITSGNITLSFAAGYSLPTDARQADWDAAFTQRRTWDGGDQQLNAATGRASLGLGSAAQASSTDFVSATTTRAANIVLAGPTTGSAAAPTFRALVAADVPALPYDYLATLAASEIAITTTATATISRQHLISGTTADYTITLPAASDNAGKLIGFRISNSATRVFTIKGNGSELIDGQNTRIMWAGESATLYCDGTGWQKIAGRTIPMTAVLRRAGTSQSVSALTWTAANMDTQVSGFSRMFNSANGRVAIVRPGTYACTGFAYCNATGFGNIALDLNTPSGAVGYGVAVTNGASSTNESASFSAVFSCAANDQVLTTVYLSGGTTTINTILSPTTAVTEVPSW